MANPENIKKRNGFDKHPENINKNGRPKGFKGMVATLRDVVGSDGYMIVEDIIELDEDKKETGDIIKFGKIKIPKGEMIVLTAARKAIAGDMKAIEFITDRLEGKAKQTIETAITEHRTQLDEIDLTDLTLEELKLAHKLGMRRTIPKV